MLDLDSLVQVIQRWVLVRDLTDVDSQRLPNLDFSQKRPFDDPLIFSQSQHQEVLNTASRSETPPNDEQLSDLIIPVNPDKTPEVSLEYPLSGTNSSCEILQPLLSSSINATINSFFDPSFPVLPGQTDAYSAPSRALEIPIIPTPENSATVTSLPIIMNIEDVSDEVLTSRYLSCLVSRPEFHWMRTKIRFELKSEHLDKFR
jgi:hypothetical protein